MERDGAVIIRRFSSPTDDGLCTYVVIFGADDMEGLGVHRKLCHGEGQLTAVLNALRVRDVQRVIEEARHMEYLGRRVRVTLAQLQGAGMVDARDSRGRRSERLAA